MADDRLRTDYPTFFDHELPPSSMAVQHMRLLREEYIALAAAVLSMCPPNRARSIAMTDLEYSLMRAIQSLAMTGELIDPRAPLEDTPLG